MILTKITSRPEENEFDYLEKKKEREFEYTLHDSIETASTNSVLPSWVTTNWSIDFSFAITAVINVTIRSYQIYKIPEKFFEALLEKAETTMRKNELAVKKIYSIFLETLDSNFPEKRSAMSWKRCDFILEKNFYSNSMHYMPIVF